MVFYYVPFSWGRRAVSSPRASPAMARFAAMRLKWRLLQTNRPLGDGAFRRVFSRGDVDRSTLRGGGRGGRSLRESVRKTNSGDEKETTAYGASEKKNDRKRIGIEAQMHRERLTRSATRAYRHRWSVAKSNYGTQSSELLQARTNRRPKREEGAAPSPRPLSLTEYFSFAKPAALGGHWRSKGLLRKPYITISILGPRSVCSNTRFLICDHSIWNYLDAP